MFLVRAATHAARISARRLRVYRGAAPVIVSTMRCDNRSGAPSAQPAVLLPLLCREGKRSAFHAVRDRWQRAARGLRHPWPWPRGQRSIGDQTTLGMEAEPNAKPPCEITRRRERSPHDPRIVERIERVAADWMCGKREDLAANAEGAYSQLVASRDGVSQRDGVRTNASRRYAAPRSGPIVATYRCVA